MVLEGKAQPKLELLRTIWMNMQIAFTVPAGISLGWSSSLLGDGWWLVGRKELFAAVPFCREIGALAKQPLPQYGRV